MKKDKRISHIDDERSLGNSIIITLKDGFCHDLQSNQLGQSDSVHVFGIDTMADLSDEMKKVSRCDCVECCAALVYDHDDENIYNQPSIASSK